LFALQVGDEVVVAGEMKPSELKVQTIARPGGAPVAIPQGPKPPGPSDRAAADGDAAAAALRQVGLAPIAQPLRRPKHFEFAARRSNGDLVEAHVEFDGRVRKVRPLAPDEPKWATKLAGAGRSS
jgi:hypothetical protein